MKVRFLTPLVLESHPNGDQLWRLREEFRVGVDLGATEIVPKGFITDLASVPRVPILYLLAGGRARKASVLHDYLYRTQAPKRYSDLVFYAAMLEEGIERPLAWLMYQAVANFGSDAYKRYDAASEER